MDEPENLLLTADELDAFLVRMRKSPCSWCGGMDWGMHIDPSTQTTAANLRSSPRVRLTQKGGTVNGSVSMGTEDALVVAVTECRTCGHLDTFNYFSISQMVRAEQRSGKDNGNNSSI